MKRKLFYIVLVVTVWILVCPSQTTNGIVSQDASFSPSFPFAEKHDLDFGDIHGSVTLTVENPVLKTTDDLSIKVRFVNAGKSVDFFNLFLDSGILPSAQIAVYDENHNYLFQIVSMTSHVSGTSWDDWTYLPGGRCIVEFEKSFTPRIWRLTPGNYYVQLIYYKSFIQLDPPWRETDPDLRAKQARLKNFETHFDKSELFRSNAVKITITK